MSPATRTSFYTESTVPSTVWGPGTLAGRAILALGEATLKSLDRIIDRESRAIQKRFEAIRASIPHLTPEMYSDLVELSRPDLYPQYILEMAFEMLIHQLHLGYGAAVALSVAQLSLSEAHLVIFRMFTSRKLALYEDDDLGRRSALDLLSTLVQVQPEMTSACFDVLDDFVRDPQFCMHRLRFREHPILHIHAEERLNIPLICRTPLAEIQLRFSEDHMYRWKNWKLLEGAGLAPENRIFHIGSVLLNAVSENWYWTPEVFDAAVDLFDFLRYSPVPEFRRAATDHLLACISSTRDSWEPLSIVLNFISRSAVSGSRPSLGLRYEPYAPDTPSSPTSAHSRTISKTTSEEVLQNHPQLRQFLRYADLRTHARDAHRFWNYDSIVGESLSLSETLVGSPSDIASDKEPQFTTVKF
ncbi:hypothetical protein C8F04DRAFT_1236381 [Mycena alexandri]|uniref:Uncharacterized protein n=1 Tax=Mycena alexandri TaxID=1745969 RepID=A0AAD6SNY4_9AGAR|nr:hypothetical protein C8F04DRAFT_1236381 [Mycena alexandri]